MRALSGQWIARLSGAKPAGGGGTPGTLIVRSNVSGATVMLDGAEVGTLSRKTLSIEDVSPGKHEITVEKPGFGVSTQVFTIGAGQALPLTLTLLRGDGTEGDEGGAAADRCEREPACPPADEAPGGDDSMRSWVRTGFWVSLGVSAVSFGLAAKYGLDVRSVNKDLDPFRRLPNPPRKTDHDGWTASSPRATAPRRASGSSSASAPPPPSPVATCSTRATSTRKRAPAPRPPTTTGCGFFRPPTPPRGASPPSSIFEPGRDDGRELPGHPAAG